MNWEEDFRDWVTNHELNCYGNEKYNFFTIAVIGYIKNKIIPSEQRQRSTELLSAFNELKAIYMNVNEDGEPVASITEILTAWDKLEEAIKFDVK